MGAIMIGRRSLVVLLLPMILIEVVLVSMIHAYSENSSPADQFSGRHYREKMRKMQAFKASFAQRDSISVPRSSNISPSPSLSATAPSPSFLAPAPSPSVSSTPSPREYHVTSYGADPTGEIDSTDSILRAISDAVQGPGNGFLIKGIVNLGGVRINLDGGNYKISRPLRLPVAGLGNLVVYLLSIILVLLNLTIFSFRGFCNQRLFYVLGVFVSSYLSSFSTRLVNNYKSQ